MVALPLILEIQRHIFLEPLCVWASNKTTFLKTLTPGSTATPWAELWTAQQGFLSQEAWVPPASAPAPPPLPPQLVRCSIYWGLGTRPLTFIATDTLSDGRLAILCVQTGFFFF